MQFDSMGRPVPQMKHFLYRQPHRLHPIRLIHRFLCMESQFATRILSRKSRGTAEDMEYLCTAKTNGDVEELVTMSKVGRSIPSRTEQVQEVVGKYLRFFHDTGSNGSRINLLCLGCGVGREVVFPLSRMRDEARLAKIGCTCLDLDPVAISLSKRLASENGLDDNIDYIQTDILNIKGLVDKGRVPKSDVLVEIGLHEYREEADMRAWINHYINDALTDDGVYITSSMRGHWGLPRFTMDVAGWKLIYKDLKKTVGIINESGLRVVESFYEPMGMHGIVVAKKRRV